jgi:hypothetical protein
MKNKRYYTGWYFFYDGVNFLGIEKRFDEVIEPAVGPFKTFGEAKLEAVEWFRFYERASRSAIRRIRQTRREIRK